MKGFDKVKSNLKKLPDKIGEAGAKGLREVGKNIFDESQAQVPVDTGHLKSTGNITESGSGKGIKITIAYTADYAAFVHEILSYYHPHGSAKYLEDPFNRWVGHLETVVSNNIEKVL